MEGTPVTILCHLSLWMSPTWTAEQSKTFLSFSVWKDVVELLELGHILVVQMASQPWVSYSGFGQQPCFCGCKQETTPNLKRGNCNNMWTCECVDFFMISKGWHETYTGCVLLWKKNWITLFTRILRFVCFFELLIPYVVLYLVIILTFFV